MYIHEAASVLLCPWKCRLQNVTEKYFSTVQLIFFGVIIEKLQGLIWDLWDSCIDGKARLRRSEGEKRTQVEQTQSCCTIEICGKCRNFQQHTLTSVKLKRSPMLPTKRSTSPAYCSMMREHELQDNGCVWKQLWEDEEEESWENVTRWWNSGLSWKTKQTKKKNSYSSAGAVGVDRGEPATVECLLHVGLSGLRLVPSDLKQLVLRTAGRQSACENTIGGKIVNGSDKRRRQHLVPCLLDLG